MSKTGGKSTARRRPTESAPALCPPPTAHAPAADDLPQFEQRLFHALIEHSTDAIALIDPAGAIRYLSPSVTRVLGYTMAELMGRDAFERVHPDDLSPAKNLFASLLGKPSGSIISVELRYRHRDGAWRWLEVTATNLLADPLVGTVAINFRDISARKQAEARLAMFAEVTFEGILESEDGRIVDCNEQLARMLGYSVAELKGMMITSLIATPEDRDRVIANIQQSRELMVEVALLRKDGTQLVAEAHGRPLVPGSLTRHTAFRDITARKRAADALRASEARLAMFAEATFEGIIESEAGRIVDCNEQYARMSGYSVAELKGMEIASLIAPEDRGRVMANIRQGRETVNEHAMICKDGRRIIVEVHGWPVVPGSLTRHTALRDITERKRAEEMVRASEERFRRLTEASIIGIITVDLHTITSANDEFLRIVGYSRADLDAGRIDWQRMTPPEFLPRHRNAVAQLRQRGWCEPFEKEYLRKDGSRVPALTGAARLTQEPLTWISFVLDLTERKRAEAALQRAHDTLEQRVRTRTAELEKANTLLGKEMTRRGALEKQVLEISEAEQRRIGQDLHDSLCQQLAGLAMMCQGLQQDLATQCPSAATEAAQVGSLIGKALQQARDLARGLCPVELQRNDLVCALRDLAGSIETLFGVACEVAAAEAVVLPNPTVAMQLYRIAQEAISNAIRHGGARRIMLGLTRHDQQGMLTISDDGGGFPEKPPVPAGLGLGIMHYRARLVGASLEIRRAGPTGGTIVTCVFPAAHLGLTPEKPRAGDAP